MDLSATITRELLHRVEFLEKQSLIAHSSVLDLETHCIFIFSGYRLEQGAVLIPVRPFDNPKWPQYVTVAENWRFGL